MKNAKYYVLLHFLLLIYSVSGIFSKFAAGEEFLSLIWCFYYGIIIILMGIYAVCWQQILKHLPLNIAFSNKAITLVWSMVWGHCIFKEELTFTNVIGGVIVLAGVILVVSNEGERDE